MRKFTTQILSLLTALSFAGALSAQTVEDAIGAADNATGGDKLGLTVEGYFMYGLLGGNGSQNYDSLVAENLINQSGTGALKYKFYGASALGGGANVGYQIAEGLDVVAGIKIASYSAPTVTATGTTGAVTGALPIFLWQETEYNKLKNGALALGTVSGAGSALSANYIAFGMGCIAADSGCVTRDATTGAVTSATNATQSGVKGAIGYNVGEEKLAALWSSSIADSSGNARTGTYSGTLDTSFTTTVINLGLRSKTQAFAGEFYAGAGLNIALGTEITQTIAVTGTGSEDLGINGGTYVRKFGTSISGLYGELGYNYDVMPNLYLGGGVRLNFNVPNNVGETATITYTKAGATVATFTETKSESHTNGAESYVLDSGTSYTNKGEADAFGMTDIQVQLNVGYRL